MAWIGKFWQKSPKSIVIHVLYSMQSWMRQINNLFLIIIDKYYTERLPVAKIAKMSLKMLKIIFGFCGNEKTIAFFLISVYRKNLSKHGFFSRKCDWFFLFCRCFCNAVRLSVFKAVEMREFFDWFHTMFWLISNSFSAD